MRRISKHRKGFTLAEEVVTVVLVGILIAASSAILLNCMRIFCRNVISMTAQFKGIAVMQQLEGNLAYATTISTTEITDSATYPYIAKIYVSGASGSKYLYADTKVARSKTKDGTIDESKIDKHENNKICKLGSYDVKYTLTPDTTNNTITIDLQVSRNGSVYYSEKRNVELKNSSCVAISYDSSTGTYLYIGSLE